jgi:hypothetical protein
MHNGIESLDHPVIAVDSLDQARTVYERLGFTIPPRGSHIEWGTGNLCIMFPDDYLEMRGILDPERFTMNLDQHLEEYGEGLMGVAFRTEDAKASNLELNANGVATPELKYLTRNFEHPEGWTQPSFEICVPEADGIEGLMHVVVLQHMTPELVRKDEYLQHANTVTGVNGMSGVIDDEEQIAGKMRHLFGEPAVKQTSEGVFVTLPTGQRIHLLNAHAYENWYGKQDWPADQTRLGAMQLQVSSLNSVFEILKNNDIEHATVDATTIRVGPADTCGLILDFTESDPR